MCMCLILYCIAGLFSGLKYSSLKYLLDYIFVVLPKLLLNFYLMSIKFSEISFSGFEPARKLIRHEINQLYCTKSVYVCIIMYCVFLVLIVY